MTTKRCSICDGSGKTTHMNSWFLQDGFYRVKCGICGGSGESTFRDAAYERGQALLRRLSRNFPPTPSRKEQ